MYEYRADYLRDKKNEIVYVSLYRLATKDSAPEEYVNGVWKLTKAAWQAFQNEGSGSELLNDPLRLTEEEANEIIERWKENMNDKS
jgi:hypothetical protein